MKRVIIIGVLIFGIANIYGEDFVVSATPVPSLRIERGFNLSYDLRFPTLDPTIRPEIAFLEIPVEFEGQPVELILVNPDYNPTWGARVLDTNEVVPPPPPSYPVLVDESGVVTFDASSFIPDLLTGRPLRVLVRPGIPGETIRRVAFTGNATLTVKYYR